MSGIPLRPLRHRGQIEELPALAHVPTAPGHLDQGPARRADARPLRRRTGLQAARQIGGKGALNRGPSVNKCMIPAITVHPYVDIFYHIVIIQGDPSGWRLHFVDFDLVVTLSVLFFLGS